MHLLKASANVLTAQHLKPGRKQHISPEQKYDRRLAKNRKSAAVSRVYTELLRKELEFELKESADTVKRYEKQIRRIDEQITKDK